MKSIFLSFTDFQFIFKCFSFPFLTEIILSLNIIIYIWLLFTYHFLKLMKIYLSNVWPDIEKIIK